MKKKKRPEGSVRCQCCGQMVFPAQIRPCGRTARERMCVMCCKAQGCYWLRRSEGRYTCAWSEEAESERRRYLEENVL